MLGIDIVVILFNFVYFLIIGLVFILLFSVSSLLNIVLGKIVGMVNWLLFFFCFCYLLYIMWLGFV